MTVPAMVAPDRTAPTGRCGGLCACRTPGVVHVTTRLLASSATGHLHGRLVRLATRRGLAAERGRGFVEIRGADLDAFVLAVDDELSPTERSELRACFVDPAAPDTTLLGEAFGALTFASLAVRLRHPAVLAAMADQRAFFAEYQPIVDLATGVTVAHEALLRARIDDRRVMPDVLFGVAEAAEQIHVLDRIGRETAIGGAAGWLGTDSLFVNFVPTSIYRPELCLKTTEIAIDKAGIALDQLVFEVVESARVEKTEHLLTVLRYYRERGCRVALDDVGSGYATLNLVAEVVPDVVKIDGELVRALPGPAATAIIGAIVTLSHELGATVIAEQVETADQASAAAALGADWAQGWHFGRPVARERPDRRLRQEEPVPWQRGRAGDQDLVGADAEPALED